MAEGFHILNDPQFHTDDRGIQKRVAIQLLTVAGLLMEQRVNLEILAALASLTDDERVLVKRARQLVAAATATALHGETPHG